jgi:hypothetical protein
MIMNILVALAGFLEPHCIAMELVNLQEEATRRTLRNLKATILSEH